jgi:hypothetical protein
MPPKRALDTHSEHTGRDRKRQKINHARTIDTGKSTTSSVPPGAVFACNISRFTHEFLALQQNPASIDVVKFTEVQILVSAVQGVSYVTH